jgi:anti-sigma factor RsiW
MNSDSELQRLRELSWRRPLDASEQSALRARCAADPRAMADAAEDNALTEALARLPDAPVPSNFTARVLNAIQRDESDRRRSRTGRPAWWRGLVPRFALAAAVAAACLMTFRHFENVQRVRAVKNWLAVASPALSNPEVIEDFDVIRQLSPALAADEELIQLMQ